VLQEATYRPDGLHGAEAGLLYLLDGGILLLGELLVGGLQLLHLGLEGDLGSAELLLLLRDLGLIQGHQRTEPGGR
jgi:hypothetical protein